MASFLMIHGAFQGGWVWNKTADILNQKGHSVYAPTLGGCSYLYHGPDSTRDLLSYISEAEMYAKIEDLNEIILVAHSFSGMICGALMMRMPERIRQAVFVDAVIPQQHRSFATIAGDSFTQMLEKSKTPTGEVKPWPVQMFGVDENNAAWFEDRLRPFPVKAFHSPFPDCLEPSPIKVSHISCKHTMSPFIREMAAKAKGMGWPLFQLNSAHCPMVTHPAELSQTMLKACGLN